jgi:GTP-dependent phosphoenolpyruvate carboxykinase
MEWPIAECKRSLAVPSPEEPGWGFIVFLDVCIIFMYFNVKKASCIFHRNPEFGHFGRVASFICYETNRY